MREASAPYRADLAAFAREAPARLTLEAADVSPALVPALDRLTRHLAAAHRALDRASFTTGAPAASLGEIRFRS